MKIALIRRRWTPTGGAERYLLGLAKELRKQGCKPYLICQSWSETPPGLFEEVYSLPIAGQRAQEPELFASAVNIFLNKNPFDTVLSLERGIKADIYRAGDGVHREWLARRVFFRPIHGWLQNWFNPKNSVIKKLEKQTFSLSMTRHVIANSTMVRKNILRYFDYPAEQISIIPNGINTTLFGSGNRAEGRTALGLSPNEFVCLLVGAGKERKGHSFAQRVSNEAGVKLVIIDSPPPCSMPHVYAAADVFLFPTLYDPFANVTLEAMAAGLPVVTTHDNGGSEVISSGINGFVVSNAKEIKAMTDHINMLKDPIIRRNIGEAARITASQYTLELNVQRTVELCQKISQIK